MNELGELRPSQLIFTFGVGSLVDLPNMSAMVMGLDDWDTVVAALGLVPTIKDRLDSEAEKLANEWLTKHKSAIKKLTDERQEVYRQIREMSAHPLDVDLARPNTWMQPTTAREPNGKEFDLPRFEKHLLCDSDGLFPEDFNSWEDKVVLAELQREGAIRKFHPAQIRNVRQNHHIIESDVCDPARAGMFVADSCCGLR